MDNWPGTSGENQTQGAVPVIRRSDAGDRNGCEAATSRAGGGKKEIRAALGSSLLATGFISYKLLEILIKIHA